MSEEKQIKEMAKIVSNAINVWVYEKPPISQPQFVATAIHCAGYHKQSEGEWEFVEEEEFVYCLCRCSACGKKVFFDVHEERYNYCPNCGAKMKGGAE